MFKKKVSGSKAILVWAKRETQDYPDVHIFDLCVSWVNGLALCALMHTFAGDDQIPYDDLKADDENDFRHNLELAFQVAESNFNIFRLLDVDDMLIKPHPDEKSLQTYLASVYNALKTRPKKSTPIGLKKYKEMLEEKKKQEELEKLVCGYCHMDLPENKKEVVELSNLNFHEKCFHCYECRKKLDDEFCEYQKMPFCMNCGQKAMQEDLQVNRKKFSRSHSVSTQMQEKNDLGHHNFSRLGKSTSDLFRDPNPPEKKESPLSNIASKFSNPSSKPKENPNPTPKPNFKLTRKLSLFIPGEEDHVNKPINNISLKEFTKNLDPKPKETKPKTITKVTKVVKNESPLTKKVVNNETPPKKTPSTERPTLTKSKLSTSVSNLNSMLDVLMSPQTKNEGGSSKNLLDILINPVPKTENETPKETQNEIKVETKLKTQNETPKETPKETQNETTVVETKVETQNETPIKTQNETQNETTVVETKVETQNETPSQTTKETPQKDNGSTSINTPEKKTGSFIKKIKLPNCPSCKIPLDIEGEKFKCSSCGKTMKRKNSSTLGSTTDLGSTSPVIMERNSSNISVSQPITKKSNDNLNNSSGEILNRGSSTPKTIKIPNCPTCKVKLETEGEKFKCPSCSKLFNRKN